MHLGHHIRDAHTRQSTFSSIDFVKNKTKRTKREIYKPVPPNVRPCRMLGAASFFSFKTLQQSVFDVLYMARWKNRKKKQNLAEQNLPKYFIIIKNKKI